MLRDFENFMNYQNHLDKIRLAKEESGQRGSGVQTSLQSLFATEDPSNHSMLLAMGCSDIQAEYVLQRADNDLEKAIVILLESPMKVLKQDIRQIEKRDTPQKLKKLEHVPSLCSPKPSMHGIGTPRQ